MRTERLTDPCHDMYEAALALYRVSFPPHEQRQARSQAAILRDNAYHFDLLYDGDTFVGLMLYWETETFLYVEHFCVLPELRNRHYGQKALMLLAQKGKTIILEIDPPRDEIARRRKGFYERCGFVENPYPHVHPPYRREDHGHELVIMSRPHGISQEMYDAFYRYLRHRVMHNVFDEKTICISSYASPLGTITLAGDGSALTGLWFDGQKYFGSTLPRETVRREDIPVFAETKRWLDIYFSGKEPGFTPELRYDLTPFREAVCDILRTIPYGCTMTYGEIAERLAAQLGKAHMSAQAVGGAVGHNPISLIIPCHRVVGTNGSLTGYAGGIDRKVRLLELERADMSGLFVPEKGTAL